jgi:hypothetical protein
LSVKKLTLAEGIQTPALVIVSVTTLPAPHQITYPLKPKKPRRDGASSWWAWVELNHRPHAYQAGTDTRSDGFPGDNMFAATMLGLRCYRFCYHDKHPG